MRGGFTFVEVMVSLLILSVGIVAVLESFQVSVRALGVSRERLQADILIHEIAASVERKALDARSSETAFEKGFHLDRDNQFQWSTDIVDLGGTSSRRLYRVDIHVWREGGYREYRAATYQAVSDY